MNIWRSCMLIAATTAVVGCASNKEPAVFSDQKSYALNVVQAAGMKDIRDHAIPQAEYDRLVDSPFYGAASTPIMYNAPAPGVSPGAGLTLGLLSMVFTPTADSSNDTIIAWMPQDMAPTIDEATSLLRDRISEALSKATHDLGYEIPNPPYLSYSRFTGDGTTILLIDEMKGCSAAPVETSRFKYCSAHAYLRAPSLSEAPSELTGNAYPSYAFRVRSHRHNGIVVRTPDEVTIDKLAFFQKVSSHLPAWVFIYAAPEKKNSKQKNASFPVLFSQGKPHLFVTPSQP